MTTEGSNRGELSGFCPAGNSLWVYPEEGCDFRGGQQNFGFVGSSQLPSPFGKQVLFAPYDRKYSAPEILRQASM
jgi:hypothetical protein